jgi:hypothetical protein
MCVGFAEEDAMIIWTPVAVNEKPFLRDNVLGKVLLPEYSAAVIGTSVILRVYAGGATLRPWTTPSFALTTIPFATRDEAQAWVNENRADVDYASKAPASEA